MVVMGSQWFSYVLNVSSVLLVGSHRFSVFSNVLSGSRRFSVVLVGSRFSMFLSCFCWFS